LAQPTISQHLKELKNAGITKGIIEGTAICYSIDEKAFSKLQDFFSSVAGKLEEKKNNCC
jgi:ArsR family transcriptional regulator